jgi:prolipoprotein diacylglyceryltransferase
MKFSRADPGYIDKLDLINIFIIIVFMVDILLKLQLHMSFFYLDNSKVEFCGFVYFVVYGLLRLCINFSN